jgi:hypothetical protein
MTGKLKLRLCLAVDSNGRTIWITDAHRDAGKRFIVHTDEILTAFVELEAAFRAQARDWLPPWSDDRCPKSLVDQIVCLDDQP